MNYAPIRPKPCAPVLNGGHVLSRGIAGAWLVGQGADNGVDGNIGVHDASRWDLTLDQAVDSGGVSLTPGNDGLLATSGTGSNGAIFGATGTGSFGVHPLIGGPPFTVAVIVFATANGVSGSYNERYFWSGDASSTDDYIAILLNSTSFRYWVRTGGAVEGSADWSSITVAATSGYHVLVGVSRATDDHEFYVDGLSVGTSTTSTTSGAYAGFVRIGILALLDSSPNYGIANVSSAFQWTRALGSDEVRAFSLDPYAMFRHDHRPAILFAEALAGSGGLKLAGSGPRPGMPLAGSGGLAG